MKLSVIYPICSWPDPKDLNGKPHPFLFESLDSVFNDVNLDIELLIGIDGVRPWLLSYLNYWKETRNIGSGKIKIYEIPFSGTYGNRQRNFLLKEASGNIISFMDHDDIYLPNALKMVFNEFSLNPKSPHFFKIKISMYGDHDKSKHGIVTLGGIEVENNLVKGKIGGHMFVVPNIKQHLSEWPETIYEADYHFIKNTCKSFSGVGINPKWSDVYIAHIRPWSSGYMSE
jgi:hypothetical protein